MKSDLRITSEGRPYFIRVKNMKNLSPIFMVLFLLGACSSPPSMNKKVSVQSQTPAAVPAEKIEKPVNVNFSMLSPDWPVGWQWIDPDEKQEPTPHNVKGGVLRITVPLDKRLDAGGGNAPRFMKSFIGDFQIETRLKFYPQENHQGAGLLIFRDANNFMLLERGYGGAGGGGGGIRLDVRKPDAFESLVTPKQLPTDAAEVELKIIRRGKIFTAFWRENENGEWREVGELASDYPETIQAGIFACNTAEEINADFVHIRLLPPVNQ